MVHSPLFIPAYRVRKRLFAEFLATCSVDTVGVFAPVLGYAPGMDGRIIHEPFKAEILPTAPARCLVGVDAVDSVL